MVNPISTFKKIHFPKTQPRDVYLKNTQAQGSSKYSKKLTQRSGIPKSRIFGQPLRVYRGERAKWPTTGGRQLCVTRFFVIRSMKSTTEELSIKLDFNSAVKPECAEEKQKSPFAQKTKKNDLEQLPKRACYLENQNPICS